MTVIEGLFHDGRSSASPPARLQAWPASNRLIVFRAGFEKEYALDSVKVSPRIGHIARRLGFPDGASFETLDNDAVDALLRGCRGWRRARLADYLESCRAWVLASLLCTAFIVWCSVSLGIPYLAERAAYAIPLELEVQMGEQALQTLDGLAFSPTGLTAQQQERGRRLFFGLLAGLDIGGAHKLQFRAMGQIANAFTLPSGLIIVTDRLMELADKDEELQAVLAHELGHAHYRHSLRSWLQNSATAVLVASVLGDVSSVSANVAAAPTVLLEYQYSREFEEQADDFAAQLLAKHGIAICHLGIILNKLEASMPEDDQSLPDFLSTHPATQKRIRRLEGDRDATCGRT